ncbi:ATPase P [Gracilibacillus halophilus YIM-C55.5]|uniref:Cd(2+)-exporting ATPase n=1 Tax=Gracilibacillus halophilus YIM-C55.5 TaxID=1308866 RepID=N4W8L7_9BACI|nr:ATPase P [Gracilibacillus halophilus YIM-C55.5]
MANLKAIAFDKTGTLTEGKPSVTNILSFKESEEEVLQIAAALESYSEHPLAQAILQEAVDLPRVEATDFQSLPGKGVKATIDGVTYQIGNATLFSHIDRPDIDEWEQQGKTVVFVGTTDHVIGCIAMADEPRDRVSKVIKRLHQHNVEHTIMLTGDNQRVAQSIASKMNVSDIKANLFPEEKWTALKELKRKYPQVAMVGDGINDAPALAEASVGIAMGGAGTDVALETADVALMGDDLDKLPDSIELSKKTLQIIKQNIGFALALKALALLLVIPGWLTLWLAIFADMGATLLVVLNALRLAKKAQK